jgi:hypothetical protein
MGTATLTVSRGNLWLGRLRQFAAWLGRSWRARAVRRPLEVQQTLVVGKGTVALMAIDGERVLVGVTQGCICFQPIGATRKAATTESFSDEFSQGVAGRT